MGGKMKSRGGRADAPSTGGLRLTRRKLKALKRDGDRDSTALVTTTGSTGSPSNSDMDEPHVDGYIKVELELESGSELETLMEVNSQQEYIDIDDFSDQVSTDVDVDIGEVNVKVLKYPDYEYMPQSEAEDGQNSNTPANVILARSDCEVTSRDPKHGDLPTTTSKSSKPTLIVEQATTSPGAQDEEEFDLRPVALDDLSGKFQEVNMLVELYEKELGHDKVRQIRTEAEVRLKSQLLSCVTNGSNSSPNKSNSLIQNNERSSTCFLSATKGKSALCSPLYNEVGMATEFAVNSNGHCFFCLDTIPSVRMELGPGPAQPGSPNSSLQYLTRYLRSEMQKGIKGMSPAISHLLAKLEKSSLSVELCVGCASLNGRLSELCRQLEKLEIEVGSCLGLIHEKLTTAGIEKTEELRQLVDSSCGCDFNSVSLELLEKFRGEAITTCSEKLRADKQIQKLTTNDISAEKSKAEASVGCVFTNTQMAAVAKREFPDTKILTGNGLRSERIDLGEEMIEDMINRNAKMKKMCTRTTNKEPETRDVKNSFATIPEVSPQESGEKLKLKNPRTECRNEVTDNAFENTALKAEEQNNNQFKRAKKQTLPDMVVKIRPESQATVGTSMSSINQETGKRKCGVCSMEFSSRTGVTCHYERVHLKVRYKCVVCGEQFTDRSNCNAHQKTAHLGVRYECHVCQKSFKQHKLLNAHQRATGCGKKLGSLSPQDIPQGSGGPSALNVPTKLNKGHGNDDARTLNQTVI